MQLDARGVPATPTLDALVRDHIDVLSRRYTVALGGSGFDSVIVLAGSEQRWPRDDQAYPLRVDPYFAQWLPLAAADSAIVYAPGRKPRLLYARHEDFWHVPPAPVAEPWASCFEVELRRPDEMAGYIDRAPPTAAIIGRGPAAAGDHAADARTSPIIARLDYARAIKTRYETHCMGEANRVAARGHRAVAAAFAEGLAEFDLHLRYAQALRLTDAELPYPTIIGLNEHAATLHYQHRQRTPPDTLRSLLIDGGAAVHGYAADITRTYAREPGPFADLIHSIDALQQTLCDEVGSGVDFVALNERAHELLAAVLAEHKLVTCSAEAAYEAGITRTFLPHGLGHLLGLQVHDVGGHLADPEGRLRAPPAHHPYLRLTRRLEPGFVVTIEPGLYLIPSLLEELRGRTRTAVNWLRVEALVPFGGIRIEDNVQVESNGKSNLTRAAFAELESR